MLNSFLHYIGATFISIGMLFGGSFGSVVNTSPTGIVPSVFETYMASQQAVSDTTMTLASGALRDGTSLSGYVCFTVDSNTSTLEYECGTVSGTNVTNILRGIDATTGTTTIASLKFAHRRGADVKITDYPALTIATNQLNGSQTIPNLMTYANTVSITGSSPTSTIATVDYVNNTASAGAANASEVVKGIVELSTTAEAQAGTSSGGTGARLVLPGSMATSSNDVAGIHIPITQSNGTIKSNQIDQTGAYTWSGASTFTNTNLFNSLQRFNVAPEFGTFTATSTTATSTISGNLQISKNATTTNLVISGACTGCTNATIVSASHTDSTTNGGTINLTATCSAGKVVSGGGWSFSGIYPVTQSYPSSANAWTAGWRCNSGSCGPETITTYAICVNP